MKIIIFIFLIVFLRVLFLRALLRAKSIFHNLISNIFYLFLSAFFINYYLTDVLSR